jgi:hypothetical protein
MLDGAAADMSHSVHLTTSKMDAEYCELARWSQVQFKRLIVSIRGTCTALYGSSHSSRIFRTAQTFLSLRKFTTLFTTVVEPFDPRQVMLVLREGNRWRFALENR